MAKENYHAGRTAHSKYVKNVLSIPSYMFDKSGLTQCNPPKPGGMTGAANRASQDRLQKIEDEGDYVPNSSGRPAHPGYRPLRATNSKPGQRYMSPLADNTIMTPPGRTSPGEGPPIQSSEQFLPLKIEDKVQVLDSREMNN